MSAVAPSLHIKGSYPAGFIAAPVAGYLVGHAVVRYGSQGIQGLSPNGAGLFQILATVTTMFFCRLTDRPAKEDRNTHRVAACVISYGVGFLALKYGTNYSINHWAALTNAAVAAVFTRLAILAVYKSGML